MRTFKISPPKWELSFKKDQLFLWSVGLWILFIFFSIFYLILNFTRLPVSVPLFYSRLWGEDQLAPKIYLWLLPVGSLFLGIFNFGFSLRFYKNDLFLSRLLLGVAPVLSLLTALSLINIINLIR